MPSFPVRRGKRSHADEAILVEDLFLGDGIRGTSVAQVERRLMERVAESFGA